MGALVTYWFDGSVATITMDDGKANALSPALQADLVAALDRATADQAAVVLAGREGKFSAGFDLSVLTAGGPEALGMLRGGFTLAERLLSFPAPVVMACTGHAIAMGLFLLQSGDHRVGTAGPYKLVANEVAIGLTLPHSAVAILRHRMTPSAFDRAANLAAMFSPDTAVAAGLLDEVVEPGDVLDRAHEVAMELAKLDRTAHAGTKLRTRAALLDDVRAGLSEYD